MSIKLNYKFIYESELENKTISFITYDGSISSNINEMKWVGEN